MNHLLNLVGLATGLALYAMLLAMVLIGHHAPESTDPLPLATAILGVLWNLCSLSVYVLPRVGLDAAVAPMAALGFVALGFLPAVVVHSVVRGERGARPRRISVGLPALAYAASASAAVLQVLELWALRPVPSAMAMRLLTWSFIGLMVPLALVTRRQPGARRALWAASLAAFAVSAFHLSQFQEVGNAWPVELAGHHASIPLAVAILYQDFPFALADIFLKRALLLIGLVAAAFMGLTLGGVTLDTPPTRLGLLAMCSVLTALAYPAFRRGASWFVDRILLARPDYRLLEASMARRLQGRDSINEVLDEVRASVARALSASASDCSPLAESSSMAVEPLVDAQTPPLVRLLVPTSEPPSYVMTFRLTGGRRILSDDSAALSAIAVLAARRIDGIRLTLERYDRALREQEVVTLATEAELRALRAQLNPHFLFNALTTIGHLIQTAPDRALGTLMRLTTLLRAVLRSEGQYTTLGRELDLVETYLEIERARFEDRLRVTVDVAADVRDIRVPSLVLQPIVENAVKHGIAPRRAGGELIISASIDGPLDGGKEQLLLRVADTGDGVGADALARGRQHGVGLNNVERRLACCYGTAATLSIVSTPGRGTIAELRMPVDPPPMLADQKKAG